MRGHGVFILSLVINMAMVIVAAIIIHVRIFFIVLIFFLCVNEGGASKKERCQIFTQMDVRR